MKNMPSDAQVSQALKTAEKRIEILVIKINRLAGTLLAKGDYAGSDALVKFARAVQEYRVEFSSVRSKWRDIIHPASQQVNHAKAETLPLWEYYRPILKVLMDLGGEASFQDIMKAIKPSLSGFIKTGDMETMANGLPRWQVMIRRARKTMIKEGFLDSRQKGSWRITSAGRQAATNCDDKGKQ